MDGEPVAYPPALLYLPVVPRRILENDVEGATGHSLKPCLDSHSILGQVSPGQDEETVF